jgi:hypothetical protein
MTSLLNGYTIEDMRAFYSQCASGTTHIWSNEEATSEWIEKLRAANPQSDDVKPLDWVTSMLQQGLRERPTADQIVSAILEYDSEHAFFCSHCFGEQSGSTASSFASDSLSDASSETAVNPSLSEALSLAVFPAEEVVADEKAVDPVLQGFHDEGTVTTEVLDILNMYDGDNSEIDDLELEEYREYQKLAASSIQDDSSDSNTVVDEEPSAVQISQEGEVLSSENEPARPKNFVQLRDEYVTRDFCRICF